MWYIELTANPQREQGVFVLVLKAPRQKTRGRKIQKNYGARTALTEFK